MEGPLSAACKTLTRSARSSCKLPFHNLRAMFANTIKLMLDDFALRSKSCWLEIVSNFRRRSFVQEVSERIRQGIRFTTHVESK